MNFRINNSGKRTLNKGMTYVELVVVLGIFAVITGVVIFNYGDFQEKVDVRNLSNEIALQIVEAQKNAVSGVGAVPNTSSSWKPAYGVVFSTAGDHGLDEKSFIYFADVNNNKAFDDLSCSLPPIPDGGECLDLLEITKENEISALDVFYQDMTSESIDYASLVFTRPDSGAYITAGTMGLSISYIQISVSSPSGISDKIKVYASGRIELD